MSFLVEKGTSEDRRGCSLSSTRWGGGETLKDLWPRGICGGKAGLLLLALGCLPRLPFATAADDQDRCACRSVEVMDVPKKAGRVTDSADEAMPVIRRSAGHPLRCMQHLQCKCSSGADLGRHGMLGVEAGSTVNVIGMVSPSALLQRRTLPGPCLSADPARGAS